MTVAGHPALLDVVASPHDDSIGKPEEGDVWLG
jgi:hypothetical protein